MRSPSGNARCLTLVLYRASTFLFMASLLTLALSRASSSVSRFARSPSSEEAAVKYWTLHVGCRISIGSTASVPYTRPNGVSRVDD